MVGALELLVINLPIAGLFRIRERRFGAIGSIAHAPASLVT
jgi:hypothetical protein